MSKHHLDFEAKPTGSITDKLLFILEAAAILVVSANKLSAKISKRRSTVILARRDVQGVAKQLREAAIMIDNLLAIIEQREMAYLCNKQLKHDVVLSQSANAPNKRKRNHGRKE